MLQFGCNFTPDGGYHGPVVPCVYVGGGLLRPLAYVSSFVPVYVCKECGFGRPESEGVKGDGKCCCVIGSVCGKDVFEPFQCSVVLARSGY